MRIRAIIPLLAWAIVAGCLETDQAYTLNPDGSGKVVYEVVFISTAVGVGPAAEDPNIAVRRAILKILEESRGVEAWTDVAYELRQDGRIFFRGTAYYPDVEKLKLHMMKGGIFTWRPDGRGGMALQMRQPGAQSKIIRPLPPGTSPARVEALVEAQRKKWTDSLRLTGGMVRALDIHLAFDLPGRVRDLDNFTRGEGSTVTLDFEGPKMLEAMNELVYDDAFMEEAVRQGYDLMGGPGASRFINERVYGLKGPARVTVGGSLTERFDYASEMREARAREPEMRRRLGLADLPSALGEPAKRRPEPKG